jgi:plasmid stabilization system protein ParE
MRAHFTPQAEIDLEEIGDYIALDNPRRAVSLIRGCNAARAMGRLDQLGRC